MEVTGGPEEHLRQTIERLLPGTLDILTRGAEEALAESRPLIPSRTGTLRDSIHLTTDVSKTTVSVSLVSDVAYAPYAHFSRYTHDELERIIGKARTEEGRERLRLKMRRIHGDGAPTEALVMAQAIRVTVGLSMMSRRQAIKAALYTQLVEVIRG